jgi:hypothetical protein
MNVVFEGNYKAADNDIKSSGEKENSFLIFW